MPKLCKIEDCYVCIKCLEKLLDLVVGRLAAYVVVNCDEREFELGAGLDNDKLVGLQVESRLRLNAHLQPSESCYATLVPFRVMRQLFRYSSPRPR